VNKTGGTVEEHRERMLNGKLVEVAVSDYVRRHWPLRWLPASNAGDFERWAADDFRIKDKLGVLRVDVAGPNKTGLWGKTSFNKPSADLHLCGRLAHGQVEAVGWLRPAEFAAGASQRPHDWASFEVWMDNYATVKGA